MTTREVTSPSGVLSAGVDRVAHCIEIAAEHELPGDVLIRMINRALDPLVPGGLSAEQIRIVVRCALAHPAARAHPR